MAPSELLTRAADLIRDTAALAIAPPWSACGRSVMDGPDEDHEVALTPTTTTARWIALMSPAVARHLESILRRAAADIVVYVPAWNSRPRPEGEVDRLIERQFGGALGLARAVLGEKEEQK